MCGQSAFAGISVDFPQNGIKTSRLDVIFNFFIPSFLIDSQNHFRKTPRSSRDKFFTASLISSMFIVRDLSLTGA